jgi:hypothetical protein
MNHPNYEPSDLPAIRTIIELIGGPRDGDLLEWFDEPQTFLDRRWLGHAWCESWWRRREVNGRSVYTDRGTLAMDFVKTIIVEG